MAGDVPIKLRRPNGFWKPFNEFVQGRIVATGQRPTSEEIAKWYAENKDTAFKDPPTLQETRLQAKGLKHPDQARALQQMWYQARKKQRQRTGGSGRAYRDGADDDAADGDYDMDDMEQPASPSSLESEDTGSADALTSLASAACLAAAVAKQSARAGAAAVRGGKQAQAHPPPEGKLQAVPQPSHGQGTKWKGAPSQAAVLELALSGARERAASPGVAPALLGGLELPIPGLRLDSSGQLLPLLQGGQLQLQQRPPPLARGNSLQQYALSAALEDGVYHVQGGMLKPVSLDLASSLTVSALAKAQAAAAAAAEPKELPPPPAQQQQQLQQQLLVRPRPGGGYDLVPVSLAATPAGLQGGAPAGPGGLDLAAGASCPSALLAALLAGGGHGARAVSAAAVKPSLLSAQSSLPLTAAATSSAGLALPLPQTSLSTAASAGSHSLAGLPLSTADAAALLLGTGAGAGAGSLHGLPTAARLQALLQQMKEEGGHFDRRIDGDNGCGDKLGSVMEAAEAAEQGRCKRARLAYDQPGASSPSVQQQQQLQALLWPQGSGGIRRGGTVAPASVPSSPSGAVVGGSEGRRQHHHAMRSHSDSDPAAPHHDCHSQQQQQEDNANAVAETRLGSGSAKGEDSAHSPATNADGGALCRTTSNARVLARALVSNGSGKDVSDTRGERLGTAARLDALAALAATLPASSSPSPSYSLLAGVSSSSSAALLSTSSEAPRESGAEASGLPPAVPVGSVLFTLRQQLLQRADQGTASRQQQQQQVDLRTLLQAAQLQGLPGSSGLASRAGVSPALQLHPLDLENYLASAPASASVAALSGAAAPADLAGLAGSMLLDCNGGSGSGGGSNAASRCYLLSLGQQDAAAAAPGRTAAPASSITASATPSLAALGSGGGAGGAAVLPWSALLGAGQQQQQQHDLGSLLTLLQGGRVSVGEVLRATATSLA